MSNVNDVSKLTQTITSVAEKQTTQTQETTVRKQQSAQVDTEAVKVSSDFASPEESQARAAKVQRISSQVDSGTYNPPMKDVATAVITDLFS